MLTRPLGGPHVFRKIAPGPRKHVRKLGASMNSDRNANRRPEGGKMKLSEAVEKVIGLAKDIREYWETELPKRHPDYPVMNPGEEELPPPPEEKKLAKLFASLPKDMVYQIGLLINLGRGDFDVREL